MSRSIDRWTDVGQTGGLMDVGGLVLMCTGSWIAGERGGEVIE